MVTASSDGTVRVWDSKTADCVTAFRPPQATPSGEVGVLAVAPHPGNVDHVVVCTRSPTVYLMTLQGQVRCVYPAVGPYLTHQGSVHHVCMYARHRAPRDAAGAGALTDSLHIPAGVLQAQGSPVVNITAV